MQLKSPAAEDYEKARELCVGSVHFEIGAIPCNCEKIAQALAEAALIHLVIPTTDL